MYRPVTTALARPITGKVSQARQEELKNKTRPEERVLELDYSKSLDSPNISHLAGVEELALISHFRYAGHSEDDHLARSHASDVQSSQALGDAERGSLSSGRQAEERNHKLCRGSSTPGSAST